MGADFLAEGTIMVSPVKRWNQHFGAPSGKRKKGIVPTHASSQREGKPTE